MRPKPVDIYSKKNDENTGLLVCLHGFTQSPKRMLDYTGFNEDFATQVNCNIIFLGAMFYWARYEKESRDTKYILTEVEMQRKNDKVYVAGFSAGACLVNTLVRYYSSHFKGAISYAGLISDHSTLSSSIPTKVLVLNNNNDKLVSMDKAYAIRNLYKASGINVSMGVGVGSTKTGHSWDQKLNPMIGRFLG